MKTGRSIAMLIFVLMACLFLPTMSLAAKHGLLIGVGKYANLPPKLQLDGPTYDIASLKKVLIENWGVPAGNISVLIDDQATKKGILTALENLANNAKAGDFIFIYFSGHGTSSFDPSSKKLGMDPYTGALCPTEIRVGVSAEQFLEQLIVGTRDLKPIFERLEKDKKVLAVFDSCYSGESVRGVLLKGRPKFVPMTWEEQPQASGTVTTAPPPPYPYQNLVYISAASKREFALDIGKDQIERGQKTFDGKPHGALTDVLLRGMAGAADSNGDGKITYKELYQYVRSNVTKFSPQTPQLLAKERSVITDEPIISDKIVISPSGEPAEKNLLVKITGLDPTLAGQISAMKGIKLVNEGEHLLVEKKGTSFNLYVSGGQILATFADGESAQMLHRVSRQVEINELFRYAFTKPSFNVFIRLLNEKGEPNDKGVLVEGEKFGLTIRPDAEAYLLLIDVDTLGGLNVLYPIDQKELEPLKAGQEVPFTDIQVVRPFGVDNVLALAFKNKPAGIEQIMGKNFKPIDSIEPLMAIIRNAGPDGAQAMLQVKTCSKNDLEVGK